MERVSRWSCSSVSCSSWISERDDGTGGSQGLPGAGLFFSNASLTKQSLGTVVVEVLVTTVPTTYEVEKKNLRTLSSAAAGFRSGILLRSCRPSLMNVHNRFLTNRKDHLTNLMHERIEAAASLDLASHLPELAVGPPVPFPVPLWHVPLWSQPRNHPQ